MPPITLVTLPAILEACLACSVVTASGGLDAASYPRKPYPFLLSVVSSAVLLLLAKFIYQKALTLSPLSLTIPFLSATPALLLATAYVLVGGTWSPHYLRYPTRVAPSRCAEGGREDTCLHACMCGGGRLHLHGWILLPA